MVLMLSLIWHKITIGLNSVFGVDVVFSDVIKHLPHTLLLKNFGSNFGGLLDYHATLITRGALGYVPYHKGAIQ